MSIGTVTFTPRGADSWADPWGEYAALRTHDPVHHVVPPEHPERDYYVLSRHADILAAAVDTQTFSSAQGLTTAYGEIEAIGLAEPPLVMQDPPAYFAALVERRRREPLDDPGPDTVAHLVAAGRADDQDGLVAVLGYVFTMVTGGNDTTTGLLGGAVQLLAADPAQRARLTSGEVPVEVALEELLRLTSPVQGLARTTTRDVELHGVEVPAGRKVLLLYAAGNRDPERYGPDADSLDVGRRPSQILTFSQGSHHCLGAAAARLQGRVALEELLAAYPDFEVDPAGVRWAPGPYVRRPAAVPFVGRP